MTASVEISAAPDQRWYDNPVLAGELVRLEPLAPRHAEGLLAAADSDDVFRWLSMSRPGTTAEMAAVVSQFLEKAANRENVPWVQISAASDRVAGMTTFYDVVPAYRTVAIGHTWLGQRFWRTGLNTEAKLLLLERAFETLGAVRVVWHTHQNNARSREAISRLGATFEGLLRKHKPLPAGGWRTTAQFAMTDDDWPAVRDRLVARLDAG